MSISLEFIGYLAGILTTASFVPQALAAYRARSLEAISLVGILTLTVGNVLWLSYGIVIDSWPIIAANAVTVVLCGAIVLRKALS